MMSTLSLKLKAEEKYYIQVLYLALYIIIFYGSISFILSVLLTLIIIFIYQLLSNKKDTKLPIGFYLCVSNIIVIIVSNVLINFLI